MDHFHQPQPMTKPIIISVLFHALVIALFVLGIPFFGKQYLAKKPQFTVNLVYEGAQNPFGSPLPQKEETSLPVKSEPIPQAMPSPAPPPQNDQKNNAAKSAIVPPPPPQSQKTAPAPTPAPLPKTPEKKTLSRQDLLRELEKAMDKNKSPKTPDVKKEKTEDKNPPTKAVQPPSKNDQKITAPAPTQPDQLAELMKAMDRTKASSDTPSKKKRASQAASNGTLPTSNNIANPTQSTALGLIDLGFGSPRRRALLACRCRDAECQSVAGGIATDHQPRRHCRKSGNCRYGAL